ncbi:MAG: hypothetical protein GEU74_14540 [Nitriliruptorales bacterium]|nr:hypothetical protein [Nitriliruptorales bacterium]
MRITRTHAWRLAATGVMVAGAMAGAALPAAAHETCSDVGFLDVEVHGQHVVRDYVVEGQISWPPAGGVGTAIAGQGAAIPGGPGPGFHFPNGFAPGASFCIPQSQSPDFHVD